MVIRAIVYAKDKREALCKAKEIFEKLCECQRPFDYYVTFDMDGYGVSGKDRWGNLPVVAKADSDEGKMLIEEGMKFTRECFMDKLAKVREILNTYSDRQIWENNPDLIRYYFYCLGQRGGSEIFLYDNCGSGIINEKHLQDVLNKWNLPEYKDLDIWVVPADVHF